MAKMGTNKLIRRNILVETFKGNVVKSHPLNLVF